MVAMTPDADTHERRYIRNVPVSLWRRVRILAAERNMTIGNLVVEAIEHYLNSDQAYEDRD